MHWSLKIVIAFCVFAILEGLLHLDSTIALFGKQLGEAESLVTNIVYEASVILITIGLIRRKRLAAFAYIAFQLLGVSIFLTNYIMLDAKQIEQLAGSAVGVMSFNAVLVMVVSMVGLTLPVIWKIDYFDR